LERALRKLASEIRAVPASEHATINVDVQGVVAATLAAVPRLRQLRPELQAITTLDLTPYDALEDYALALAYAHGAYLVASAPSTPAETAREAASVRQVLLSDAQALAGRGLIDASRLEGIGGRGYRNLAFDLIGLVRVLRDAWPTLEGKTLLTLEELESAEVLANRLLVEVGTRDGPTVMSQARRDRAGAFTLFLRAYRYAQRLLRFLRHDEGDADQILPSPYADKGRRKTASNDEEPEVRLVAIARPYSLPANSPSTAGDPSNAASGAAQSGASGPIPGETLPLAGGSGVVGLPGVKRFDD